MKTPFTKFAWLLGFCLLAQVSNAFETNPHSGGGLNLIPMYGYPHVEKPGWYKEADEKFIRCMVVETSAPPNSMEEDKNCTNRFPSREEASKNVAKFGWNYFHKGDYSTAMKRFNQAWLLNPNNYAAFWGFGLLLSQQDKFAESIIYFEKSISLVESNDEGRLQLLNDAANVYSEQAHKESDKVKAQTSFAKANALLEEAVKIDPQNGKTYINWAISLYFQGDHLQAWKMVKKSRTLKDCGCAAAKEFIETALSKVMPEPQE
ncbi:MAG: hypothetical protein PHU06_09755 [Gallionella sp.]|nr:hypothetical protein [Gallionella sp.]MDD4959175.1 hypothetical protein [Gallionella sp.]